MKQTLKTRLASINLKRPMAAGSLGLAAAASQAAAVQIETSELTAQIAAGATAVSAIAIAGLSLYALAKVYKMVKAAF